MRLPFLLLTALLCATAAQANVVVVFRYDDYVGKQTNNPGFGKSEDRFHADEIVLHAFTARKLPLTVAVVPYASYDGKTPRGPLTEDEPRMKLMREAIAAGVAQPALHSLAVADPNVHYVGLGYEEEREKIRLGKADLEDWFGTEVRVIVPPEHQYDGAAVEGADDAGIHILSDGAGPSYHPLAYWVPALYPGPIPPDTVRKAATYPEDCLIVIMLHPFDFKANNLFGTAQFDESSFGRYVDDIIQTPGVEALSMIDAVAKYPALVSARHQKTLHAGLEVLRAGKLYGPIVGGMWRDRPRDVAWATAVWEPIANKRYFGHAVLGLASLLVMAGLWSRLWRIGQVRLLLLLAPIAGAFAVYAQAPGQSLGLNRQALLVALLIAALYSISRYVDMIARQVRWLKARPPERR